MSGELPPVLKIPDQPRHLKLYRFQWVGIPLIVLMPILALFGVFGLTAQHVEDATPDLVLRVDYPARFRHKQTTRLVALVENTSPRTLDTLVVAFDPEYVRRFSELIFIPAPTEPFEMEFLDVKPGETRLVWAELHGERYGRHRGTIDAYAVGGPDTARVTVSSLIFP